MIININNEIVRTYDGVSAWCDQHNDLHIAWDGEFEHAIIIESFHTHAFVRALARILPEEAE